MSLLPTRVFSRTAFNYQRHTLRSFNKKPLSNNNNFNSFRGFRSTVARMGVHNIGSKSALQEVLDESKSASQIVVLDAFATWCGPCKVIAPTIAQWSENQFKHVKFIKLDVDEVADVAQELGIRAMPTFIIFKNGEAVKEVVGANPKALQTFITEYAGEGSKEEI